MICRVKPAAYYNLSVKIAKRYILISDDVRTETSGKLIVIGLHTPDIKVPQLPFVIPLAFTAAISIEGAGSFEMSGVLRHCDSRDLVLQFGAKGEVKKSGPALIPFKFPAVSFEKAGSYEVSLALEGQPEMTERFEISILEEQKVESHE